MKELGNRLKYCRIRTGLTQKQAGRQAGIKGQTMSSYEKGKALPSLKVLFALASNYNVSTDWLLGLNSKNTLKDDMPESEA